MTILKPLFEQDPARPAAKAGKAVITYGRLCSDIDAMARWLLASGLEPGEWVTIHCRQLANPDYWDWIMHLGTIRAGLVHSTGALPPSVVESGVVGVHAAAIGYLDELPPTASPRLKLRFDPPGSEPLDEQMPQEDANVSLEALERQAGRLMATSGTTGTPKIVQWDGDLLERRLDQVRNLTDIHADTRLFTALGMLTATGLRYPLVAWQKGAFAFLASMAGEDTDLRQIVDNVDFLAASPYRMQVLLNTVPGEWAGKDRRVIELFGGRVPPAMRQEVLSRCAATVNMSYGATEIGRVASGDTSLIARHPGAVGMLEAGLSIEIVDRQNTPCRAGQEGIVRLKSHLMCQGYVGNAPSALAEPTSPFRDGWFYPGDLGIVFEDGLLAITGREAETINLSGAKFSPVLLEQRVAEIGEVDDVCVMALNNSSVDVLAVAVVCKAGTDLPSLRQKVAARLPRQFPLLLVRVAKIPRNAMGRVPRREFAEQVAALVQKKTAQDNASNR